MGEFYHLSLHIDGAQVAVSNLAESRKRHIQLAGGAGICDEHDDGVGIWLACGLQ